MNRWSICAALVGVMAAVAGCTSPAEEDRCVVKEAALSFGISGGMDVIMVEANVAWSYELTEPAVDWLDVQQASDRLMLTVSSNPGDDRQTMIRIIPESDVLPVRQVVVAQQGSRPGLEVTTKRTVFSCEADESRVIDVRATGGVMWSATVPVEAQDWLEVEQQENDLIVRTTARNEGTTRETTVTLSALDASVAPVEIVICQQGLMDTRPEVMVKTVQLPAEGGTGLALTSNRMWNSVQFTDAQDNVVEPDWLTVSESRDDEGQYCLSVTATANETAVARAVNLNVLFNVEDSIVSMVTSIKQEGAGE